MLQVTKETFETDMKNHKGLFLVDFYADWCGPCRMLGPVLEELSNDPEFKTVKFGKLDTEKYPELTEEHGVSGIPCLILFNKGVEYTRIVGYAPKPVLRSKLLEITKGFKEN